MGLESGAYWSTVYDPEAAPDITLFTGFPDADHPDTWARLFYYTSGGLNLFGGTTDGLDELIDEAVTTGDESLYGDIAEVVASTGLWHTIADLKVSSAFQKDVTGVEGATTRCSASPSTSPSLSPAE
ncbi:hypothetical protein GCM10025876_09050 [Demequina litorisediminis]|uniref:Uncharacterized protein n=1 Tax=Demequina litorisediminis TaxID=1849022 RepID=A0ABQ6IB74_9MICO|nr:hypothetical protein GCM10025876_09050 [Demequina litorisediminis]